MKNRLFELIIILVAALLLTLGNAVDWKSNINQAETETVRRMLEFREER